jgi:hypothetical protein
VHTDFWWGNLRERDHFEDGKLDWSIILQRIFQKWNGGMDWIDLAQERDRRRVVVNEVRSLWCSYNGENFLLSEELYIFKDFVPLRYLVSCLFR